MFSNTNLSQLFKSSEELSNKLSNFTFSSNTRSNNIYSGVHNTRTLGKGEKFLQFREFRQGDETTNIDWRKSASTKKLLIREKEKEISDIIYINVDNSSSMLFKSKKSLSDKFFISSLIALTLCRVFGRYREQVFLFNDKRLPVKCSSNINNFNSNFLKVFKENAFPDTMSFKNNSFCILISDFFFKRGKINDFLTKLKNKGVSGLLLQILDPLEIDFKFERNIKLVDMETNKKLLLGNNSSFEEEYKTNLNTLKSQLLDLSKNNNFIFLQHSTGSNLNGFLQKIIKNILINKGKID